MSGMSPWLLRKKHIVLASDKGWDTYRGIALYYRALIKRRKQEFGDGTEDALSDLYMSGSIFKRVGREDWLIEVDDLLGELYIRNNYADSAKIRLEHAWNRIPNASLEKNDSLSLTGLVLQGFGNLYLNLHSDTSKALDYYNQSLLNYQTSDHNNNASIARTQMAIGDIYLGKKQYDKAETFYLKSFEYSQKNNDHNNIIDISYSSGYLKYYQYLSFDKSQRSEYLYLLDEALVYLKNGLVYQGENRYRLFLMTGIIFHLKK